MVFRVWRHVVHVGPVEGLSRSELPYGAKHAFGGGREPGDDQAAHVVLLALGDGDVVGDGGCGVVELRLASTWALM